MKRSLKLYLVAGILASAVLLSFVIERFIVTSDGIALKDELIGRHLAVAEESGEGPPVPITFDQLDEARPLDLIEMALEFPGDLQALEGRRVRLIGFMAPFDSLNDMRRCMIVPSYVGCSFCTPPSLTQVVYVEQAERASGRFPFIEPPSDVSGILRLPRTGSGHEGHEQGFVYVIEDAVVTPYLAEDAPERAAGHGGSPTDAAAHLARPAVLDEIPLETLAAEVSELRGLQALRPITFERVSAAQLIARVREETERAYPVEDREGLVAAFVLLGFLESESTDWVELFTSLGLLQRIACVDEEGDRIELLEAATTADPFTRLELVKEIADALARQHFPVARPPSELHADSNRALEALRQGHKQLVAYRYARRSNISPAGRPPEGLFAGFPILEAVPPRLDLWHWLPWETGPFFVEARTGATKGLPRIDELFQRPPVTTRELFRPSLYGVDGGHAGSIPEDFADAVLPERPVLVESFGLGGLVPWLSGSLPVDEAKMVVGRVLTDRYALWRFPDGGSALLLETRWPDRETARRFLENIPPHPHQFLTNPSAGAIAVSVVRADSEAALARVRCLEGQTISKIPLAPPTASSFNLLRETDNP